VSARLPRWLKERAELAGLLTVLAVAAVLRLAYLSEDYGHPDEVIATKVVASLDANRDWDSNWARADLDSEFRYDQYNFSSYHYALYLFSLLVDALPGTTSWEAEREGLSLHRLFSALLAIVAVGQVAWLGRKLAGPVAGVGAGAGSALLPLLVQDAHYARPEAFVTVLTLGVVALSWPQAVWSPRRLIAAGFVAGLLVACKVSMLALVWLPLVSLWPVREFRVGWTRATAAPVLVGMAVLVGFYLGAPYALIDPVAYLNGINHLMLQYAGLHPPYGLIEGGPVGVMLVRYAAATAGWAGLALGMIGAASLVRSRQWAVLALIAGPLAVFCAYFSTRTVFFERNLSHVAPLACVLAGVGLGALHRALDHRGAGWAGLGTAVVAAVAVARPLDLSHRLVFNHYSQAGQRQMLAVESEVQARFPGLEVQFYEVMSNRARDSLLTHFERGGPPVIVRLVDYHDEWSRHYGPSLLAPFVAEEIAVNPSLFSDVPGCTLHTYSSWTDRYCLVSGLKDR
jgi:hypothetical protein